MFQSSGRYFNHQTHLTDTKTTLEISVTGTTKIVSKYEINVCEKSILFEETSPFVSLCLVGVTVSQYFCGCHTLSTPSTNTKLEKHNITISVTEIDSYLD